MQLGANIPLVLRGTAADMLEAKGGVVHAIAPDETVYAALERMNQHRVGALLVMESTRLVGMVSERDYTRKVILLGRASKDTPVRQIMSTPVVTIVRTTTLTECMRIMTERSFRHLPVLDNDEVIGVLSIGDLVRGVLMQQAETIERLNSFIRADYPA